MIDIILGTSEYLPPGFGHSYNLGCWTLSQLLEPFEPVNIKLYIIVPYTYSGKLEYVTFQVQ
jgi:hypothetical protein